MPESLSCKLNKTQEVDYEITAWLDTSVGNEYQDQELIADFHWWLEDVKSESGGSSGSHRPSQNEPGSSSETDETIDLINGVRTGDAARPFLWLLLIVFCIGCLIWIIRKGKEDK